MSANQKHTSTGAQLSRAALMLPLAVLVLAGSASPQRRPGTVLCHQKISDT